MTEVPRCAARIQRDAPVSRTGIRRRLRALRLHLNFDVCGNVAAYRLDGVPLCTTHAQEHFNDCLRKLREDSDDYIPEGASNGVPALARGHSPE